MQMTEEKSVHSHRKPWIWGVTLVGVAACLAMGLFFFRQQTSGDRQTELVRQSPFLVTLKVVGGWQTSPWQAPVEVQVQVYTALPVEKVEFWVDGELLDTYLPPAGEDSGTVTWQTNWPHADPGSYLLTARAVAADGEVTVSNVVAYTRVVAYDPSLVHTVEEGESLETIADQYGVDADQLVPQNPVGGEASPGDQVSIPIAQPQPDAPLEDVPQVEPVGSVSTSPGKFSVWWQNLIGAGQELPLPPEIALSAFTQQGQCGVQVQITDQSENESGFVIYQASASQMVFEPVGTVGAADGETLVFEHPNQSGKLAYYAAAYNAAGEAVSPPASINLASVGCASQTSGGLAWQQNGVVVEQPVDWIYLYLSINHGDWQRVPEVEGEFITSPESFYDLVPYLGELSQLPTHSLLQMEVWGWVNGELVFLGQLETILMQTGLTGCGQAAGCREGLGWTNAIWIEPEGDATTREFRWTTDAIGATGGIYQVASQPFPDDADLNPPGLLLSGDAGDALEGYLVNGSSFTVDFEQLAAVLKGDVPMQEIALQPADNYNWLLPLLSPSGPSVEWVTDAEAEPTFYVRVVPMAGSQPAGGSSNLVSVVYQPAGEQENPLIEIPVPPELYDIEIVDFTPIIPQTLKTGCVYVTEIDHDALIIGVLKMYGGLVDGEKVYDQYLAAMQNHTPICPESYKGMGEKPWYESFLDFLGSASTWLSELYNDIKAGVIDVVATALDSLPGVDCDSTCRDLLMKGLNAGLVALGIPPELPSLEQLTDQGLDYLVEVAVEEMGVPCDDECRNLIREGIKDMANQVAQQNVDRVCGDVEWAHNNGIEPMCFPDGMTVVIAPESGTQPAVTVVRITRRMEPAAADVDLSQYQFFVSFTAETDLGEGERVQVNTGFYEGGYSVQSFSEYLPLDGPVTGAVFRGAGGSIPAMQPGESLELTLVQQPAEYWLPGHKDLIAKEGGFVRYDDFWLLYYQGHLTINAAVVCPDYSQYYSTTQSCGGGDVYETILPNQ